MKHVIEVLHMLTLLKKKFGTYVNDFWLRNLVEGQIINYNFGRIIPKFNGSTNCPKVIFFLRKCQILTDKIKVCLPERKAYFFVNGPEL